MPENPPPTIRIRLPEIDMSRLPKFLSRQMHFARRINLDRRRAQRLAERGAKDAASGFDLELGAMRCADDPIATRIEIRMGPPRHRRIAVVRTSVPVGKERALAANDEEFRARTAGRRKSASLALVDLIRPAEIRARTRIHALSAPACRRPGAARPAPISRDARTGTPATLPGSSASRAAPIHRRADPCRRRIRRGSQAGC